MDVYFITFRSVTLAQRGETVLKKQGIRCRLRRTPRWMEEQGCGYSLGLEGPGWQEAAALLRRNGIRYRKVYLQSGDGTAVEVTA